MWTWPEDEKEQRELIVRLSKSSYIRKALEALAKNPNGLSNAELDDAIGASSGWLTLWVVRQLLSLGLVQYVTELFGGPGRYQLTQKGKEILQKLPKL